MKHEFKKEICFHIDGTRWVNNPSINLLMPEERLFWLALKVFCLVAFLLAVGC